MLPLVFLLVVPLARQDPAPISPDPQTPTAPTAPATPGTPGTPGTPTRGLVTRTDAATPGYTLIAPLRSTTTFLIDTQGEVVHTWKCAFPPGNSVELLADGSILRACRVENSSMSTGGMGGRLQRIAWDGTVTWDYLLSSAERVQHHDARVLPNGNVLTLVWDDMAPSDAIAAGRDPAHVPMAGLRPDAIVELKPSPPNGAEIVWEWRARDHLIQDFDETKAHFGDVAAHPERIDFNGDHRREAPLTAVERARREEIERRMRATGYAGGGDEADAKPTDAAPTVRGPGRDTDWLHANGLHWLASHDLIVLSVRHMDEIWVIDHSTTTAEARGSTGGRWKRGGDLLARYGNPKMHAAGTAADRRLFRQHDPTWVGVEKEGLVVQVFNNGEGRPDGDYSSVDEILFPFDEERGFGATAKLVPRWSYTAPDKTSFYASFISGAQRLANGNTLVCEGTEGRIFEIQRDGTIVWEYLNPHGGDVAGPSGGRGPDRGRPPAPPDGGSPRGPGAPPGDGRGGPGGAGRERARTGLEEKALFRATHIALDHPGLAGRFEKAAPR